jgi:hypothetical protein
MGDLRGYLHVTRVEEAGLSDRKAVRSAATIRHTNGEYDRFA